MINSYVKFRESLGNVGRKLNMITPLLEYSNFPTKLSREYMNIYYTFDLGNTIFNPSSYLSCETKEEFVDKFYQFIHQILYSVLDEIKKPYISKNERYIYLKIIDSIIDFDKSVLDKVYINFINYKRRKFKKYPI